MADAGASAVVLSPATLARADEDDRQLRVRIDEVLAATDSIPLGLYECPLPYHRLIPAPLFGELARSGRFLFHKDTTCDADAIEAKLTVSANTPVNIYNANMQSLPASLVAGAAGYCGVATNVYPDLVVRFCQQVARGENDGRLHALLVQAEEVFGRTYPRSAKRLLAMQGLPIGTHCRCDVPEITPVVEVRLRALLDEVAQHRETSRDIARVPATS
jgi:4-hydroxy-tetrahydrodipicolinate synthase